MSRRLITVLIETEKIKNYWSLYLVLMLTVSQSTAQVYNDNIITAKEKILATVLGRELGWSDHPPLFFQTTSSIPSGRSSGREFGQITSSVQKKDSASKSQNDHRTCYLWMVIPEVMLVDSSMTLEETLKQMALTYSWIFYSFVLRYNDTLYKTLHVTFYRDLNPSNPELVYMSFSLDLSEIKGVNFRVSTFLEVFLYGLRSYSSGFASYDSNLLVFSKRILPDPTENSTANLILAGLANKYFRPPTEQLSNFIFMYEDKIAPTINFTSDDKAYQEIAEKL